MSKQEIYELIEAIEDIRLANELMLGVIAERVSMNSDNQFKIELARKYLYNSLQRMIPIQNAVSQ